MWSVIPHVYGGENCLQTKQVNCLSQEALSLCTSCATHVQDVTNACRPRVEFSATFMHVCQCPPRSASRCNRPPWGNSRSTPEFCCMVKRKFHLSSTLFHGACGARMRRTQKQSMSVQTLPATTNQLKEDGWRYLVQTRALFCFCSLPWKWTFKAESDATPPVPILALFVGVAMTVKHISSEVSVFTFRGKGNSTGGRARDLSLQSTKHDPQEVLVGGTQ